jgi:hypothetical protein
MYSSLMTKGLGRLSVSDRKRVPSCSTTSAFSSRTKHAARRLGTTLSGSNEAFRTRALRTSSHRHLKSAYRLGSKRLGTNEGDTNELLSPPVLTTVSTFSPTSGIPSHHRVRQRSMTGDLRIESPYERQDRRLLDVEGMATASTTRCRCDFEPRRSPSPTIVDVEPLRQRCARVPRHVRPVEHS